MSSESPLLEQLGIPQGLSLDRALLTRSVESSNLDQLAYNPETQELFVQFKGGRVYSYSGVPTMIWNELLNASSHGSYFYHNIRKSYPYTRIS